jgi:hypothetical protein
MAVALLTAAVSRGHEVENEKDGTLAEPPDSTEWSLCMRSRLVFSPSPTGLSPPSDWRG